MPVLNNQTGLCIYPLTLPPLPDGRRGLRHRRQQPAHLPQVWLRGARHHAEPLPGESLPEQPHPCAAHPPSLGHADAALGNIASERCVQMCACGGGETPACCKLAASCTAAHTAGCCATPLSSAGGTSQRAGSCTGAGRQAAVPGGRCAFSDSLQHSLPFQAAALQLVYAAAHAHLRSESRRQPGQNATLPSPPHAIVPRPGVVHISCPADALQQPFADGEFDLVWSMESGEHMPGRCRAGVHARTRAPAACMACSSAETPCGGWCTPSCVPLFALALIQMCRPLQAGPACQALSNVPDQMWLVCAHAHIQPASPFLCVQTSTSLCGSWRGCAPPAAASSLLPGATGGALEGACAPLWHAQRLPAMFKLHRPLAAGMPHSCALLFTGGARPGSCHHKAPSHQTPYMSPFLPPPFFAACWRLVRRRWRPRSSRCWTASVRRTTSQPGAP